MKCPGPPACEHTCEHHHCDLCGVEMQVCPTVEKVAEFIRNFHRSPTAEDMEHAVCDDCYKFVLEMERSIPHFYG